MYVRLFFVLVYFTVCFASPILAVNPDEVKAPGMAFVILKELNQQAEQDNRLVAANEKRMRQLLAFLDNREELKDFITIDYYDIAKLMLMGPKRLELPAYDHKNLPLFNSIKEAIDYSKPCPVNFDVREGRAEYVIGYSDQELVLLVAPTHKNYTFIAIERVDE